MISIKSGWSVLLVGEIKVINHISPCQYNSYILNIYFISIWINWSQRNYVEKGKRKIHNCQFYLLSVLCDKSFQNVLYQILVRFMLLVFDFLWTASVCPFVLFLLPLYCLSFFDLRLLITIMVASVFVLCFHVWGTFTFAKFLFGYSSFRNYIYFYCKGGYKIDILCCRAGEFGTWRIFFCQSAISTFSKRLL